MTALYIASIIKVYDTEIVIWLNHMWRIYGQEVINTLLYSRLSSKKIFRSTDTVGYR